MSVRHLLFKQGVGFATPSKIYQGGKEMQPGDQIMSGVLSGQVDPLALAPAMPWESPLPFVPRYLAQRLWPQGFVPLLPAARAPAPPVPPVVTPAPAVNKVPPAKPPAPPARKRVLERGTFPEWH